MIQHNFLKVFSNQVGVENISYVLRSKIEILDNIAVVKNIMEPN